MMLSKDLKIFRSKNIIVFDKKINKNRKIYGHDLKISFPKINVLMTNGSKANKILSSFLNWLIFYLKIIFQKNQF